MAPEEELKGHEKKVKFVSKSVNQITIMDFKVLFLIYRVPHWGCGGRRFKSCRPDQFPTGVRALSCPYATQKLLVNVARSLGKRALVSSFEDHAALFSFISTN